MKKRSISLAASLLLTGLLVACGGQSSTGSSPAASGDASKTTAAVTTTAAGIKHSPTAKVGAVSIHIANNLLALGVTPAGAVIGGDVKDFLPHVADRLKNTAKLGVVTDPDMEAILALKPDVLYVDEVYSGKDISKFQKIAPTISINMDEGTWRDHLKTISTHMGKEKEADQFIKEYDAKAKQVSDMIKKEIGDGTVMAIRTTAKELRVMGMKRPLGPIMYEDLKLKPAKGVEKIVNDPFQVISQEVLPDFNADAIFIIISTGNEAKANYDQLVKSPLWQTLKAVKNNHVYVLDGQKWLDYSSLGHRMALDDAEKLFTKK
ncbi:MAG: iron-hydroxamate transporter substrate-binding protein [Paenibacillus sp.]|jgi:iron complex transport system substrate-binding protein|nr:iron-hydroxamate transporter substrate-binding protein [Paenibacillus sp.]